MPLASVQAYGPSANDFKAHAVAYMKSHHPELASLDEGDWDFDVSCEGSDGWFIFKTKYRYVDANGSGVGYEFIWEGKVLYRWWAHTRWLEHYYHYEDFCDLEVTEPVGPGVTTPGPGVYYVFIISKDKV